MKGTTRTDTRGVLTWMHMDLSPVSWGNHQPKGMCFRYWYPYHHSNATIKDRRLLLEKSIGCLRTFVVLVIIANNGKDGIRYHHCSTFCCPVIRTRDVNQIRREPPVRPWRPHVASRPVPSLLSPTSQELVRRQQPRSIPSPHPPL